MEVHDCSGGTGEERLSRWIDLGFRGFKATGRVRGLAGVLKLDDNDEVLSLVMV